MKKIIGLLTVLVTANSPVIHAQVVLNSAEGAHSYTQNFNGLPTTGNPAWTDNSSLAGWYGITAASGVFSGLIVATTGANGNFLGSFGSSSAADRALGANPGGANKAWGVRLQNSGATSITIDTISFTGEQWRTGGTGTAQIVTFGYQVSLTPITNLTSGTYTSVSGLNFTSPITSPVNTNLDGNALANRSSLSVGSLGLSIAAGSEAMLRWSFADGAGNDANLAIDDLTVAYSTIPEPSSVVMLILGTLGIFLWVRNRRCA